MRKINLANIALAKTRLTIDIEDFEVNVSDSIIRRNGENKNIGIIRYVRNDIRYEIVLIRKIESNC